MAIRILLLLFLAAIGYYAFVRRRKVPVHIVIVLGMVGLASFFVVFPDTTNAIAHLMGVGRGADLVTYVVEVTLLFVAIHYYTKFVEVREQITILVREIAFLRDRVSTLEKHGDRQTRAVTDEEREPGKA